MVEQMVGFFTSGFANPSAWGTGLAVIFGAVWIAGYCPPCFKLPWLLGVLVGFAVIASAVWLSDYFPSYFNILFIFVIVVVVANWLVDFLLAYHEWPGVHFFWRVLGVIVVSATLTWVAVSFIQIPLQTWSGQFLNRFWGQETLVGWLLLAGIPAVLLTGIVQEGAKLVPVVAYWWRRGRNIDPKLGLAIGAVAGVGFGVFEAQWLHNTIFAMGWTWGSVQTFGPMAAFGFWERFFTVAFHTAVSALAGYGLARGFGWQSYVLAAFLHGLLNYSALLFQSGTLPIIGTEIFITVVAVLVAAGALWLRWRKPEAAVEVGAEGEVSPAQISGTGPV